MPMPAVVLLGLLAVAALPATPGSDLSGRVLFTSVPVPGATITASRPVESAGERDNPAFTTLSDEDGRFRLANLEDGTWKVRIEMRGFVTIERDVTLPVPEPELVVTLTMRPFDEIVVPGSPSVTPEEPLAPPQPSDDPDIIQGSVTNAAATPFAQSRAMGNNRPRGPRTYSGTAATTLASSAWNARPYSFGGRAAAADTSDVQLAFTLRGPLRGPRMILSLQHGTGGSALTRSAIVPTAAQRAGDFSQSANVIRDPATGLPFQGNVIPADRIEPQAAALLAYYPLPNTSATSGANFERPIATTTRQDAVRFQMDAAASRRDRLSWNAAGRRTVTDADDLFGFVDERRQTSVEAGFSWTRTLSPRLQITGRYEFTRTASTLTPFFAHRTNVSGDAGIVGNEQSPINWGPPSLLFPAIADLRDASHQRASTTGHATSVSAILRRGRHTMRAGGGMRPITFTRSSQPDPRGTLSFTGAATGDALADFLLGRPAASAIAFGDTGIRLRGAAYDAYVMGDFRLAPGVTVNAGVRWDYESPFAEASGRMANLDVAPGFTDVSPVLAASPVGALSGRRYPASLVRPDRSGLQPRLAAAWRPMLASTLVIRASYGIYRNLGTYQSLADLLAQQPPFLRTLSVQGSAATPLTLANPFASLQATDTQTFASDPDLRAALVHSWHVTAQRAVGGLTFDLGYFGNKGTRLMQAFLPNTSPAGAANPCDACPSGFVYVTSGGSSNRHALQVSARRPLRNGIAGGVQYTLARATDNAATFAAGSITPSSLTLAQDWRDLDAERASSDFDQRHLVSVQLQLSTGAGLTGGSLSGSLVRSFLSGWTIDVELNAGSGLPFTPIVFTTVGGTGFVGVRPRLTGVSPEPVAPGSYANPHAYAPPLPGTWGDAGRNSIRGPAQFSLNMAIVRSFQLPRRLRLDWRLNVSNVLNRVTFAAIDTRLTSPQFGLPTHANAMRRIHTSLLFGF
jgi:trimeric autotransporter adhesin